MSNVDVIEPWQKFSKRLVTNSIGFRDFSKKNIEKENNFKKFIAALYLFYPHLSKKLYFNVSFYFEWESSSFSFIK